jgi:uncharacterized cupredoxin-like copper-binding protein
MARALSPAGRWLLRRLLALGTALAVLSAGLAGYTALAAPLPQLEQARPMALPGGPGGGSATIEVNLTDNATFSPNSLSALAGTSVTFVLHNLGHYPHSFTLSDQANFTLNRTESPAGVYAYFAAHSAINQSVAPTSSVNVTFGIPATWAGGSFEFVSVVPYQFQAGMSGFLNVTSSSATGGFLITDQTAASALAFTPAEIQVNATSFPVRIEVQVSNLGSATAHTWTLVAQPNTNMTAGGFTSYFQQHPPAVSLNVPASAGVPVFGNITLPSKGVYQYLCEIPGHFAAGMYGFLYVGVAPPAPVALPSTAIVAWWALAGAAVVLAVGGLLALSASFVGRFPPKAKTGRHH